MADELIMIIWVKRKVTWAVHVTSAIKPPVYVLHLEADGCVSREKTSLNMDQNGTETSQRCMACNRVVSRQDS
jgi:hypothetical protein